LVVDSKVKWSSKVSLPHVRSTMIVQQITYDVNNVPFLQWKVDIYACQSNCLPMSTDQQDKSDWRWHGDVYLGIKFHRLALLFTYNSTTVSGVECLMSVWHMHVLPRLVPFQHDETGTQRNFCDEFLSLQNWVYKSIRWQATNNVAGVGKVTSISRGHVLERLGI